MSELLSKPQFLIGAPSSNSGKTTITLGLLRALSKRGLKVQPFKCGPDYIDPFLHSRSSGNISINLDTYMSSENHVKQVYHQYLENSEVAVVEGVMGLFDGADRMKGSSAEVAILLNIPVILVVNAASMAYSAAPLIYGFKNYCKDIKLAGVIFNNVNTASHYQFLKEACEDCGVESLGYLPKQADISIPSRHLGLSLDTGDFDQLFDKIADAVSETIDIDRLLEITSSPVNISFGSERKTFQPKGRLKIAIAKDEAFCFTYHENLKVLEGFGEVKFFSPLKDPNLPECDFLYLPGGYPELYLEQLASNKSMLESIREYCYHNGKTYAECGGMMYLGHSITDPNGKEHLMVDYLSLKTSMLKPKLHLGYRNIKFHHLSIKGHEFHYSTLEDDQDCAKINCTILNAREKEVPSVFYKVKQTVASYVHLYWGENKDFITGLLNNSL